MTLENRYPLSIASTRQKESMLVQNFGLRSFYIAQGHNIYPIHLHLNFLTPFTPGYCSYLKHHNLLPSESNNITDPWCNIPSNWKSETIGISLHMMTKSMNRYCLQTPVYFGKNRANRSLRVSIDLVSHSFLLRLETSSCSSEEYNAGLSPILGMVEGITISIG